jgi:hypothetical protein
VTFGFIGTWNNASNREPAGFRLNGSPCSVS